MNKLGILNLIGLANRASKLTIGARTTIEGIQNKKVTIVFVSSADNTDSLRQIINKCNYYNIPIVKDITTEEIRKIVGKPSVKIVGVTDKGIKELIEKLL